MSNAPKQKTATKPESREDRENSTVVPGQKKEFYYVGEMIPNQVLVANLDPKEQANFIMQGINPETQRPGWKFFYILQPGETVSLWVEWPSSALFTNQGLFKSSILVYGDGIFPK